MAVTWTVKIDETLDTATNLAVKQLGYPSKAELIREAIRDFLLRKGVLGMIGDLHELPMLDETAQESLERLVALAVPESVRKQALDETRAEVEALVFPQTARDKTERQDEGGS